MYNSATARTGQTCTDQLLQGLVKHVQSQSVPVVGVVHEFEVSVGEGERANALNFVLVLLLDEVGHIRVPVGSDALDLCGEPPGVGGQRLHLLHVEVAELRGERRRGVLRQGQLLDAGVVGEVVVEAGVVHLPACLEELLHEAHPLLPVPVRLLPQEVRQTGPLHCLPAELEALEQIF